MRRLLTVIAVALAASWNALPATAIQDGTIDTVPYRYPNVVCVVSPDGGCGTGQVIGRRVVLTAAHVIAKGLATAVSTDAAPAAPLDDTSSLIRVERAVIHPEFFGPDGWAHDIGVLILARPINGVPFVELPTEGLLDVLQAEYGSLDKVPGGFTAVGYGVQLDERGNVIPEERHYRRYGPAYVDGLPDKWFNLNFTKSGITAGDSGGCVFLGDSFTCVGMLNTRMDTRSARSFLGQFVTLP